MNMNKVIYREIIKSDYATIKELIGEAFGFNNFIKDKLLLNTVLDSYLKDSISNSSFGKVAEKDNKVIGFILGNSKNDKNHIKYSNDASESDSREIDLILNNEENKFLLGELSKIQDSYNELIEGKEDNFQGAIQLFIVSKESRGLGVGKTLINYLFDYMKNKDVKSLYLFTDTRCNYGFYDSQNFNRLNEKELCLDSLNLKLNTFLYEYKF
ncbi:GNAT family N-acetyltransferase [Clostridium cadaveris]|nr:GNAT family N-acetyltransferase [Clostridium cadaveris]